MLKQISWSSYLTFIAFLTFLYYGWVYTKYFRISVSSGGAIRPGDLSGLRGRTHLAATDEIQSNIHSSLFPGQAPNIYNDMLSEMAAYMEQSVNPVDNKISFTNNLKLIADKYKSVEGADVILLSNIIQEKGRSICSCELSDEEMAYVWGRA